MEVKRVKDGLLIPDEFLRKLGSEIEVVSKPFAIIIKPKTVTRQMVGTSASRMDIWELIQEYETL